VPHQGTTKPAHQPNQNGTHKYHTIRGPLRHPLLPLPQEEVVAHPYPPQAAVVDHLLDRPAQVAGDHSSSPLAPQPAAGATAMAAAIQHTAPGHPRPGSGSTDCSGTSRRTVSKRRTISSSTPAAAGGACDGPAPGSSQRRLCAGLSGPAAPPAAASLGRLAPCGGLSCLGGTGAWTMSTSRPRGATSAQTPNKQQTKVLVSIHQNMCTRISNKIL
jgi:hypothetical protein